MSKPIDSYMPDPIGEVLRETMHLTTTEFGALEFLRKHYWIRGPLAADDEELARITRLPLKAWRAMSGRILAIGFRRDGDSYRHDALDALLEAATKKHAKLSAAGILANQVRWGKLPASQSESHSQSQSDRKRKPNRNPNRIAPGSQTKSSSFPKGKEEDRAGGQLRVAAAALPAAPGWEANYPKWAEYRREIGEAEWLERFASARPNGSETTLIVGTAIEKSRIVDGRARSLEAFFGAPILVKVQPRNQSEES